MFYKHLFPNIMRVGGFCATRFGLILSQSSVSRTDKGCGMWNSSSFSGMPWCCPVALCCAVLCCVRGSSLNLVVNKNSLNYCSSSDKSKRRTKTVKKSLEPKWNQTFMYSPVHRREFRERMLEITLWDQARVREEESEFLGEVSKTPFCKLISFFSAGRSLL